MATYSTFFLCEPQALHTAFPGWKPPLTQPVRRQSTSFFTGETITVESNEPEWPDENQDEPFDAGYQVAGIEGSYEEYLEARLPAFIRDFPHWTAKDTTEVEFQPLLDALPLPERLRVALYGPPSASAFAYAVPRKSVTDLTSMSERDLQMIAEQWSASMSTPEHTHSITGDQLNDGWSADEAIAVTEQP